MQKVTIEASQVDAVGVAINTALQHVQLYAARFRLRETLRAIQPHAADIEAERQALVEQYAERDADGKMVVKDNMVQFGENLDTVNERWAECQRQKVEISHRLTLDDVADLPADPKLDALELLLV